MDIPSVKLLEQKNLVGVSEKLTRSHQSNYWIIRNHWREFNRLLNVKRLNQGPNWEKFGVTYKQNGLYFYFSGISCDNEVSGFESLSIEKGNFLKFQHKGSMESLKATINAIYKQVIPNSKFELDLNRKIIQYEFYNHRFNWNNPNSIIDIFVPVKNDSEKHRFY